MKLADHYNKASIFITISVLLAGAVVYFFAISKIARTQLDRDLTEEIDEVTNYVKINKRLPRQVDFDEDQTVFFKTNRQFIPRRYFDTVYSNPQEKKIEPGRAVSGLITLDQQKYLVIITESREGTEYLVQIIALITLALMIGLLLISFLTNRYILNGLWRPFYDTLNEIKAFNVSESSVFHMTNNKVDEFTELSKAIRTMSARVKNDYQHLKQFTENASHEMMTPLAVITSKLDTLIQDEVLTSEQLDQINDIYLAAGKLFRLNQSLLLLVKIENHLIEDAEPLNLQVAINDKIRQFQELLSAREISIERNLASRPVLMSKYLLDILLNNIFSNAIRHNIVGGKIVISLTEKQMIFQNTGSAKPLNTDKLFERFEKGTQSEGTGLGLTLIKNIANLYRWEVIYAFSADLHTFEISLNH
jgi:signal transduction histidine kinase